MQPVSSTDPGRIIPSRRSGWLPFSKRFAPTSSPGCSGATRRSGRASSFSNWQPGCATGAVAAGHKRAMTITWNYAAGSETVKGFTEAFEKGGRRVVKDLNLPFPNVEFQALLTEIAAE